MERNSKKVVFWGDSITEGYGTSHEDAIYWRVLERLTGAECLGFGIGGTWIAPQRTPSENPVIDRYVAQRICELPEDADVVAVFGGSVSPSVPSPFPG